MEKKNSTNRKGFSFYLSYWESYKALTKDKDKLEFLETICKIQFLETHINNVNPTSNDLKLLFASIKHSLETSILGYCSQKGIDYNTYPCQGGSVGGSVAPCQQVQEEVKDKEEDKDKLTCLKKFIEWDWEKDEKFTDWLVKEKDKLDTNPKLKFNASFVQAKKEGMIDSINSKGTKYKDFKSAFRNWIRNAIKWELLK